jgi:hypothetical protein
VGHIGASELIVIGLIALVLLAAPVAVLVWLLKQRRTPLPRPPQLVPCSACGTGLALGVMACPQCGERRPA